MHRRPAPPITTAPEGPRPHTPRRGLVCAALLLLCGNVLAQGEAPPPLEIEIGLSYDSNPFLAPRKDYFDAQAGETVLVERRSGFFVPVRVEGWAGRGRKDRPWFAGFRLRGDTYPDRDLQNADEIYARLVLGLQRHWQGSSGRTGSLRVGPFAAYNKETYFDRDSGLDRVFGGNNIGDRFTYRSAGLELISRLPGTRRFRPTWRVRLESRDYESVPGVSDFDHLYAWAGLDVEVRVSDRTRIYLDYRLRYRDYEERLSRDRSGVFSAANPALAYLYHDAGVTVRRRLAEGWYVYLDADARLRADQFEGYYDYRRGSASVRLVRRRGGTRVEFSLRRTALEYPHAFVFDLPQDPLTGSPNPHRSYDTTTLALEGRRPIRSFLFLVLDAEYRDHASNDPRYDYARARIAGGLRWRM